VNELALNIAKMSSREIAELTGKEHRNVMRDIRDMLEQLRAAGGGLLNFERTYRDSQNKEQPEFLLPKRECLILVSGYSVLLRTRIIDRWSELEAAQDTAQKSALPSTYLDALKELVATVEAKQLLEAEN
jgi:Rha family phage regulatory protein